MNKQTCPSSSGPAAFSVFQLRIKTNICRLLASGRKCEEWGRAGAFVLSEWERQALKHVGRPSSVCTLPVFLSTLNLKQKDENSACDCWSLTVNQTSESDRSRLTVWAGSKNSAVTTCSWAFREKPPAKDFKTFSFPVTVMQSLTAGLAWADRLRLGVWCFYWTCSRYSSSVSCVSSCQHFIICTWMESSPDLCMLVQV